MRFSVPRFMPGISLTDIISGLLAGRKKRQSAIDEFEKRFASFINVKYACFVSSARAGLAALLYALDLPKGGEVLIPALTHAGIVNVFKDAGLVPRYVDILSQTYCVDPLKLEAAVTEKTVAVLPVHIYGRVCDMRAIMEIAQKHELVIIEDCAQTCGAVYDGKAAGSFGSGAIFSMGPFKSLCAMGAGMVTTSSPELAEKMKAYIGTFPLIKRMALIKKIIFVTGVCVIVKPVIWDLLMMPLLRGFARKGKDLIDMLTSEAPEGSGVSLKRPLPLQAVFGLRQLQKLTHYNRRRQINANRLYSGLRGLPEINIPTESEEGQSVFLTFPVTVSNPQDFRYLLMSERIDTHPGDQTCILNVSEGSAPVAVSSIKNMVHLPVYPQLSDSRVDAIISSVKKVIEQEK